MPADFRAKSTNSCDDPSLNNSDEDLESAHLSQKDRADNGEKLGEELQDRGSRQLEDPEVVDWDGPDDPSNPMNWSSKKKWANICVLAAINFFSPLISSMFAPGVP